MERKRLVPDRFKRIWSIVRCVAEHPGLTRFELAHRFALSERQLQADLNLIRDELRLPLERRRGYRFSNGDTSSNALNLKDIHTLFLLVGRARCDPAFPHEALDDLSAKLPHVFPAPLQPLVRKALSFHDQPGIGPGPAVFACLTEALVRRQPVKLHFTSGTSVGYLTEPIVDPEILLPHGDSWYLIGACRQRGRVVMLCVDGVESASLEV
ncbi:MAG: hypothetical protein GEU73_04870 [Chloroflexi bacterium]|nr:hypothetical protein [Chloroflexota bacterium]